MPDPVSTRAGADGAGNPRPTIVGIGASAGGLEVLKEFFAAVPADSGLAWVVVVHLAVDQESHLADLLQPHARIPVAQVTGSTMLTPDHVYVIPPDRNLSAVDSHLHLSSLEPARAARAPIDHFFRTLAASFDGHSVAVVLSGTGSDGAQGVRRVREMGGIVVVQDPDEAEFDGMPRSALDTGVVDLVLPVAEIPRRILDFDRTRPQVHPPVPVPDEDGDGDGMPRVLTHVQARTGHDFSRYKRSTIERRIERRMQLQGLEQLTEYLHVLRQDPHEAAALAEDLLINVTSFFRDASVFEHLEREVIPRLFEGKRASHRVRVWSVGCATGEEAYSLGMLLLEEAARRESPPAIQIFASDLHERSLRYGREGLYPETIAADISPERLARFFQAENGGYRVRKELRERVVFAPHNLLRDPPFSHLDLVCCRNLLIYLQRSVQEEVIELLHYALHDEGYLLLGTAETMDRADLFRVESKEHHLYRRRNVARAELRLPALPLATAPLTVPAARTVQPPRVELASYGGLHQRMVERYAPPSLLVSADQAVLHISESAGRYLQVAGGQLTSNVFRLVREELRMELRAALHLAGERQAPSRSRPVPLRIEGELRSVVMRVSPAGSGETQGLVLVLFDELGDVAGEEPASAGSNAASREVEVELERTRSRLQALVEEFETSQEEMRASNEELQSANEELRSTMEELETSREELQSINEELQTVNQENRHKVEELSQLSSDLQNLLKVTDVATLFLDRSLRILRFTPRVGELFNVRGTDRGRPLADLTHRLGYSALLEDARQVLATLIPVERDVESEDGRWHLVRVMPYRTVEDRIEGVVITLVDVSTLKRTEAALRASVAEQQQAEQALRELNQNLEQRVEERTGQIREREEERRRADAARREALRQLVGAEEEERRRISRELHDQLGQQLTGLLLGLRGVKDRLEPGELATRLEDLEQLTAGVARAVQNLALELRPAALDTLGLVVALQNHLEEWGERHGIAHDFHASGLAGDRLPREVETTLYRVVQEGLTNVLKHAHARRVSVVLERRDNVAGVILEDDGDGFEVEPTLAAAEAGNRLGLRGMRERVALLRGELQIESAPGKGTTLFVRVPAATVGSDR